MPGIEVCELMPCYAMPCYPGPDGDAICPPPCDGAGVCVPKTDPPPEYDCKSDADCAADEFCAFELCAGCACIDPTLPCDCEEYCYGYCTPIEEPPEYDCKSDADCAGDEFCAFELCAGCACLDPTLPCDCEAYCYGYCMPIEEPPVLCETDADCPAGEVCMLGPCPAAPCKIDEAGKVWCPPCYGECVPVEPPPPAGCLSDADCGAGEVCDFSLMECWDYPCWADDGTEVPPDEAGAMPWCGECYGTCVPVEPPPPPAGCLSDLDCGDGEVCDLSMMECWDYPCWAADGSGAPPPSDMPVPWCGECYGVCVPAEPPPLMCESDADCPDGMLCTDLACPAIDCGPDDASCPPCVGVCEDAPPPPPDTCMISGCSGQICAAEPMATTCEWLPWYECLALSSCGTYGPDGGCGWELNDAFLDCMMSFGG